MVTPNVAIVLYGVLVAFGVLVALGAAVLGVVLAVESRR